MQNSVFMINRVLKQQIIDKWNSGKVLIVLGPRQVGKTTLLLELIANEENCLKIDGDDLETRQLFENISFTNLKRFISNHTTVFFDEAQRISNIGLIAKQIHDQLPNIRLLISGSSALEIANEINESLTGRKWEYQLFPISWQEYVEYIGYFEARKQLENRLIFGMYPEIITNDGNEAGLLKQLSGSYLYKDLLAYSGIRKPQLLDKLLFALALQLGSEVSYNELSRSLGVNRTTIEEYISLLEKAFVIFRLPPFSRNHRSEISSSRKIYFWDNGIRNAIIGDFKAVPSRTDVGSLWENFLISERLKLNSYRQWYGRQYFWRTYAQQEIDYIEEIDGQISAFEIKWNPKKKIKFSKTFTESYPDAILNKISRENFDDFLQ